MFNWFKKPSPKYVGGAIPNPKDPRDIPASAIQPLIKPSNLPTKFSTDLSKYGVRDQKLIQSCVGQAFATITQYLQHKDTGVNYHTAARYIYSLSKYLDGYDGPGTYPRVAASVLVKDGVATTKTIADDSSLPEHKYVNFAETLEMNIDASSNKMAGYAFVPTNLESVKRAIYQNGVIAGSTQLGDWEGPRVTPRDGLGWHYTVWYGYEDTAEGTKIFFRNSWGLNWGDKGNGWFYWNDYQDHVRDIIIVTDIPNKVREEYKARWPYKYFSPGEVEGLQPKLIEMIDLAREIAGVPFIITSGYRSKEHNARIGGVPDSAHVKGLAVDLRVRSNKDRFLITKGLIMAGFERIEQATKHIHVDIDPTKPSPTMFGGVSK